MISIRKIIVENKKRTDTLIVKTSEKKTIYFISLPILQSVGKKNTEQNA